jgi:hypothetical protein
MSPRKYVFLNVGIMLVQSLCRTTQSSFPDRDKNVAAVASTDMSVILPAEQTVLACDGSVLFVYASVSPALLPYGWFSQY